MGQNTVLFLCGFKNGRKLRDFKQESRARSKKGGKVNFLHGGCLHLVVLFDYIPGLCFDIKENIVSICATTVFRHIFHDP